MLPLASRRPFLTARWEHLIVASYAVPEPLLRPLLPPGMDLDFQDGKCFASLVGFQFLDTRVLGVSWPAHRDFAEWNLRFYVRRGPVRGVVFVREFVPKPIVAVVARLIYNEPYRVARITGAIKSEPPTVTVSYTLRRGSRSHSLWVAADPESRPIQPGSREDFFLNQSWGFGTSRRGRRLQYEVVHPPWEIFPIRESVIDVSWGEMYGPEWSVMEGVQPVCVALAKGSPVSVSPLGREEA